MAKHGDSRFRLAQPEFTDIATQVKVANGRCFEGLEFKLLAAAILIANSLSGYPKNWGYR